MPLRLLEIHHPETDREMDELLEDISIVDMRRDVEEEGVLTKIIIPAEKTDRAVEILEDTFEDEEKFRITILPVEASIPRPEIEEVEESGEEESERVGVEEIYQNLMENSVISNTYLVMIFLASIVAAIGLLNNDVAIIIGSMVIAPLLQPNMALSLATTLADGELFKKSAVTAAVGILIPIIVGVVFGFLFTVDPNSAQIVSRTNITLMYILLALASGVSGALSITKGVSQALVGVMVAVALLPPIVATGLLLGSGMLGLALGSALLFSVNLVSINLSGVLTFIAQDIGPRKWWEKKEAERMVRKAAAVWILLLIVLAILIQFYRVLFLG